VLQLAVCGFLRVDLSTDRKWERSLQDRLGNYSVSSGRLSLPKRLNGGSVFPIVAPVSSISSIVGAIGMLLVALMGPTGERILLLVPLSNFRAYLYWKCIVTLAAADRAKEGPQW
jgi:hypothetical protein